jgi:hypothetical protein
MSVGSLVRSLMSCCLRLICLHDRVKTALNDSRDCGNLTVAHDVCDDGLVVLSATLM